MIMTKTPQAEAVKAIREKLGLSQEETAREIGCSVANIRVLESRGRLPKNRAVKQNLQVLAARARIEIEEVSDGAA